jgi:hypothetical protein
MQPQATNDTICTIAGCIFGAIVVFFAMSRIVAFRVSAILKNWAAQNKLKIVSGKVKRFPNKGPFNLNTNGRGQIVCFLKVQAQNGQERSCWIRCGNRFGGIWLGNQIEVKWEENEAAL